MKRIVASAAVLLLLVALMVRAAGERAPEPVRTTPAAAAPERELPREAPAAVPAAPAVAAPEKAVDPKPAPMKTAQVDGPGMPDARRIALQLTRELELGSAQQSAVEGILADRDRAIEAYFAEIRARKVFTLEDWSARMKGIKEGAYRRIEGLLDARQGAAFAALLERRGLKDTVAFRIPDDVVALNDFKD